MCVCVYWIHFSHKQPKTKENKKQRESSNVNILNNGFQDLEHQANKTVTLEGWAPWLPPVLQFTALREFSGYRTWKVPSRKLEVSLRWWDKAENQERPRKLEFSRQSTGKKRDAPRKKVQKSIETAFQVVFNKVLVSTAYKEVIWG